MNITIDGVTRPMTQQEIAELQKAQQEFVDDVKNGKVVLHNTERSSQ